MYSNRDKIVKKANEKPNETEDEVAKALFELENHVKETEVSKIKSVKFSHAQYLTEGAIKILHITVPFPILATIHKNYAIIVPYLEGKFKCPVVVVAQRTILSKYGILNLTPLLLYREEKGITKETNEQNFDCSAQRLPR